MDEARPGYVVDVEIGSAPDEVWRALRDRAAIRQWFGWDYDGLDDEIDNIFFRYATAHGSERRLSLGERGHIELLQRSGGVVLVRVVQPGVVDDEAWSTVHDGEREGWRQFLQQLRCFLERSPRGDRATIRLEGVASAASVREALDVWLPGAEWDVAPMQRATLCSERADVRLVHLQSQTPLWLEDATAVAVTLTTFGLLDDERELLADEAWRWWGSLAQEPLAILAK